MKIKFTIEFIQWVLIKFKLLPIKSFVKDSGWKSPVIIYKWKKTGVPEQLLVILRKELIIQKVTGRVSCEQNINLEDLFSEYQKEIKKK